MRGQPRAFASSVVVAGALIATVLSSAASATPPEFKETIPFAGVPIFDPCTNESFRATGVVKISLKTATSHGGVTHFGLAITSKAKGPGLLTGTKYVFIEGDHEQILLVVVPSARGSDDAFVVRFKHLDDDRFPRNYPTRRALAMESGLPISGIPRFRATVGLWIRMT